MAPTSSRPKITSSSFGLLTTGERLSGKKKTIKIPSPEKISLKKLITINDTLDSILKTLTGSQKEDKKIIDKQRKEDENKRRSEREKGLESKVFDGIKTVVSSVMKPFTSIWDWITNFLFNVFLGKVVLKLLDWFADPKNKDKIKNIIRFFKDWWPTMLGAYILFGTSFGRLARGLVAFAGKSVIGLGKVIFRLIAAIAKGKSLKTTSSASRRSRTVTNSRGRIRGGGLGGALLRGGLLIGGSLLAGLAIDKGVDTLTGGDDEEEQQSKIDVPDSPEIPILNAATGGLADIGKIFGKFGGNMMESMLGPLGMLMGSMMGGKIPNLFQGLVKGQKGIDKIPAMLTDGEFVMSKGAVQKYGVSTLEAMNAAGGGTNVPKIVKGVPHAVGGGYISRDFNGNMEGINPYDPKQMSEESFRKFVDQRIDERIYSKPLKLPQLNTPNMGVPPRSPIPASRAIVPYRGGGLVPYQSGGLIRSGVTAGLSESIPQIRTNMNVPGGRGGSGGIVGAISLTLAELFKPQIQSAVGKLYNKMGVGLGDLSDAELNKQIQEELKIQNSTISNIGPLLGGHVNSLGNDRLSLLQQELERRSPTLKGGKIVGGHKLQQESFRNAPKTMVMTDDKGRPFVGHKALRNGKLTYVRGNQPGSETSNPLEMLGRMINPNAYGDSDTRSSMLDQRIAMMNSLESFQRRGMSINAQERMMKKMGGNLRDVQNDLNARRARQSKEQSQRNLDRLTWGNVGPDMMPRRFAAEQEAGRREYDRRGGFFGQMDRWSQRAFGGPEANRRLDSQARLSEATSKQAGARAIGRYYSSSDGKYYANYNAARIARDQRRRMGVRPPTKPSPRYNPGGGRMYGGRNAGSGSRPPVNTRPVRATSGSSQSRQSARQRGIGK